MLQREEKLNEMIKETEQLKSRLTDADEDLERLKEEEMKVLDNNFLKLPIDNCLIWICLLYTSPSPRDS